MLTRALDSSLEIQIQTSVFTSVINPNISGTFITSVAIKTSYSPIVEVKLIDYNSLNPYPSIFLLNSEFIFN